MPDQHVTNQDQAAAGVERLNNDIPHQTTPVGLEQFPNPFQCNLCQKSYSRIDHLARHFRSHTNEKPFRCHVCDKDFARVDLLKRHVAAHEDDKPTRKKRKLETPPVRSRTAHACNACAEAKLKCESQKPCGRCKQKQISCEFVSPKARQSSPSIGADLTQEANDIGDAKSQPNVQVSELQLQDRVDGDITTDLPPPHQSQQPLMDSFQMPTSMTFGHAPVTGAGMENNIDNGPFVSFDNTSLADFLYEVMMPGTSHVDTEHFSIPPNDDPFASRDILNFSVDENLQLPDFDGSLLLPSMDQTMLSTSQIPQISHLVSEHYAQNNRSGTRTPVATTKGINLGAQAFRESLWQWTPAQQDHGYAEQLNLSIPQEDMNITRDAENTTNRIPLVEMKVGQSARDRVLAVILSTYEPNMYAKIVSSFPSAELLTNLLHNFFTAHSSQAETWIHASTFKQVNELRPELLACMIASGAVLSNIIIIRKLGFAIQEAIRFAIANVFEADNSTTRELHVLQAYALHLNIALWSGDRRKMEIAESFAQPLITMMRRAGYFRRSKRPFIMPLANDDADTLETKWHQWIEMESFKRLAFHLLIRNVQTSMSLLAPPLISYAEMSVEMPSSHELWTASTPVMWRDIYFSNYRGPIERFPSLPRCIYDLSSLNRVQGAVDNRFAISIILYGIWTLIWEYRQLNKVMKLQPISTPWNCGLITSGLHNEVTQLLNHFHIVADEWEAGRAMQAPEALLLYEIDLMNLHVSFEDLQLFAGKEGEEESRRVYPLLSQWADSRESREAVWHAGQVFRAAKRFRNKTLRDFPAIALYHASLALWAKAVVSMNPIRRNASKHGNVSDRKGFIDTSIAAGDDSGSNIPSDVVWIDGDEPSAMQRYLILGRETPGVRRLEGVGREAGGTRKDWATLNEPGAVMEIAIEILRVKSRGDGNAAKGACPPLVENLTRLMGSLGKAADGMRR